MKNPAGRDKAKKVIDYSLSDKGQAIWTNAFLRPGRPIELPAGLAGFVDAVSFVGDRQRLTVSGDAGKPLQVDAPNTLLMKAGDRVGLKVDPGAVRLLPSKGS